ncbi:hypothetical protein EUTSA_v10012115mg [Eutrema salsugineum]|uniref:RING-type domain-containing protein n=1 Tax=Eutrema salsugineum TaxID=72664 RepID=V4KKU7_EUTSA|nr:hypothetical protein EUTSA_v10012115mg [Eutrema salsugineum]
MIFTENTEFEHNVSPCRHSSTSLLFVQLTCTEVRRKKIRYSNMEPTSSPSLPDKSIVRHSGYFPLNKPNDVALEITRGPNGTTAISRSNNPSSSNYYSLHCARNIWLILLRFGLFNDECSTIFHDIDTAITSSSLIGRGVIIEVNIWKIITKVYSIHYLRIQEYRPNPTLEEEDNECVICMEDFKSGEELAEFPCDHHFHKACILKWMKTSHKCPLCRFLFYRH